VRKLNELNGDEFFDVIYALSPVLPMIGDMEIVKAYFHKSFSERLDGALTRKRAEESKPKPNKDVISQLNKEIADENLNIMVHDISAVVPLLSSKENRGIIFTVLSILEQKPVEEIKKYPGPKIVDMLKRVISDTNFKDFLSYAEPTEETA
jgi:hypothetical protein